MDDCVKFSIGMAVQPPTAVVDVDLHLRVRQDRHHGWIFGDESQITWIDFDDRQSFDLRIVGNDLSPCAGRQANHEDFA